MGVDAGTMASTGMPDHPPRADNADAAAGRVLPPGFTCPKCDYDLGGAEMGVCPECGREAEPGDVAKFRRRGAAAAAVNPLARRMVLAGAAVVMVMSGGASLLAIGVGAPEAAIAAAVVCGIAAAGSIGSGWMAALAAPRPERAVVRYAWLVALPWLNAPWLMVPMFAAGGVALAYTGIVSTRVADAPTLSDPAVAVWILSWLVWMCASATAVAIGSRRLKRVVFEHGVYPRGWWRWVVLAAGVVIVGAMLLGAAGVMFATGGAIRVAMGLGY